MEAKKSVKVKIKKIMSVLTAVILIVLTAALVWLFVQVARGKQADLFGYKLYVIVSDSMTPELKVGDVIFSESAEGKTIETGDVVTFLGQSGSQKGKMITHKVVEAPYIAGDGKTYIRTQGVKEGAPLDAPVQTEYVMSIMVKKLVVTGALIRLILKPLGFILIIAVPLMLLTLYQLYRLAKIRINRQERRE